ncbi:MFS transporter [soil metagenome]
MKMLLRKILRPLEPPDLPPRGTGPVRTGWGSDGNSWGSVSVTGSKYVHRRGHVTAKRRGNAARGGNGTLIATVLGSSLSFLDGSVVNVALPAIGRDLQANAAGVQWVVNAYLLPLSALVLLGGALSDRLGRKRIFLIGVALFAAASLGSLLAPTIELLHASRACQGLAAALFVPASLAILGADFEGEARGRAIGTWAAAGALSAALGPILGGWLVDHVGWRSIFAMLLPVAAAALLLGARYIAPHTPDGDDAHIDWTGAALATLALGLLTWGLTLVSNQNHGPGAMAAGGGVLAAIVFFFAEKRLGDRAMVPLGLFGTRTFTGITLLTLFLYAALAAVLLLVPYLLIARGWPASEAGATLLPASILMGLGSRISGRLAERIGARPMLTLGPILVAAGFGWFMRMPDGTIDYWKDILPAMLFVGLGLTTAVAPLTTTVMTAVDSHHAGAASGVNNATARVGGMIATALVGLALAEGGRQVPTESFHAAALVAALAALLAAAFAWWLVEPHRAAGAK